MAANITLIDKRNSHVLDSIAGVKEKLIYAIEMLEHDEWKPQKTEVFVKALEVLIEIIREEQIEQKLSTIESRLVEYMSGPTPHKLLGSANAVGFASAADKENS